MLDNCEHVVAEVAALVTELVRTCGGLHLLATSREPLCVSGEVEWLHPRKRYDGEVALVALVLFSTSAAALEFLRADAQPRVYWGPLPQLMWMALGMSAVSIAALAAAELVHRRRGRLQRSTRAVAAGPPRRQVLSDAT